LSMFWNKNLCKI